MNPHSALVPRSCPQLFRIRIYDVGRGILPFMMFDLFL